MVVATKEVTFDCAHMLTGHEGLCKNLHGHTYKVQVTVKGTDYTGRDHSKLISEGPAKGMVIDFKVLKEAMEEVITGPFDHAFIFNQDAYCASADQCAETAILKAVETFGLKAVAFTGRPTAENMACYFGFKLVSKLEQLCNAKNLPSVALVKVRVYETPTSFAEWYA